MDEEQWSDVMTLLAVMVIVDGRVFKEEIDAFINEAVALRELISFEKPFSRKTAHDWYVGNRDALKKICSTSTAHDTLNHHIESLQGNAHSNDILAAMNRIAVADENFHPQEFSTLLLAAECWGVEL